MKILVLGANGFIGHAVVEALAGSHDVYSGTRTPAPEMTNAVRVELLEPAVIDAALASVGPEVVINCAGVVENSDKARLNVTFTRNLLDAIVRGGHATKKVIGLGSAGEYGEVDRLPVAENAPRRALSAYAAAKIEEVDVALDYRDRHGLPISIARVFNPIGTRMHPRLLVPAIAMQIQEVVEGRRETIEVSRLDSMRDYLDVKDVASAIRLLAEGDAPHSVYNIGSGRSTSNRELIELMVATSRLEEAPAVVETAGEAEPRVASQADIARIECDLGWAPQHALEDAVTDVVAHHSPNRERV